MRSETVRKFLCVVIHVVFIVANNGYAAAETALRAPMSFDDDSFIRQREDRLPLYTQVLIKWQGEKTQKELAEEFRNGALIFIQMYIREGISAA